MTSDEMTTGSLGATDVERKWFAARSRWWNSTGGGSFVNPVKGNIASVKGVGAVKAGDGGVKFRAEWEDLDQENWKWMKDNRVDAATGQITVLHEEDGSPTPCAPEAMALRRGAGGSANALGNASRAARQAGQGWLGRHKVLVGFMAIVGYVLLSRYFGGPESV